MSSSKSSISRDGEEDESKCLMADDYSRAARGEKRVVWRRPTSGWMFLWANIFLLSTSILLFFGSFILQLENQSLRKRFSVPSPVLPGDDITFTTQWMEANLVVSGIPSIFQQEPSLEVDIAWRKLADTRPFAITREDVIAIGKDPERSVRFAPEFGLGKEAYAGRLDVVHQLHCLDVLRHEAYFDHYYGKRYPGGFNQTTPKHRAHLSHCIYILLQNILCNAKTDILTHTWTDAVDHPWPDFNIPHKCHDYKAIMDWQHSHAIDEERFLAMKRPGDQEPRKMSSYFKKINNPEKYGHLDDDLHDGENI
ncbi:hypothetical protein GGI35DRAFT_367021 [Trichoderma velutinum]